MKRNKDTRRFHEENDILLKDPLNGLTELEMNAAILFVDGGYPIKGNKMNALITSQYCSSIPTNIDEAISMYGLSLLSKIAHELFNVDGMEEFIDSLIMKTGNEDDWIKRKARDLVLKYEDTNPSVAANLVDKLMKSSGLYQAKETEKSAVTETTKKLQEMWKKNSEIRRGGIDATKKTV